ncbi:MAG: exosortase/archaeosortase family protein [Dehalococcoidia bacterium]|nr:exosortase/archaeosortase family protein [Dehalococcoidia bacterium]
MSLKRRLALWFVISLGFSIPYFGEFREYISVLVSSHGQTLEQYGVYHWGVLGFCLLWVIFNHRELAARISCGRLAPPFVILGCALVGISVVLPCHDQFTTFAVLLSWLGIFAIFFGREVVVPAILLGIYGFGLTFSPWANNLFGQQLADATAWMVTGVMTGITGVSVTVSEQIVRFPSLSGLDISVTVNAGCSGLSTLGIFFPLFVLMMLDITLPFKKAVQMFLIGTAGTWLLNALRVLIVLLTGYYRGIYALEDMHLVISYFIFPLWYALFAFIYLKQAGKWGTRWLRKEQESTDVT